ncbi:MAG: hypothetical protein PHS04_00470 [Tissierellia bacterium]|nr:hypothetical protein [Tissierellia bacterium]
MKEEILTLIDHIATDDLIRDIKQDSFVLLSFNEDLKDRKLDNTKILNSRDIELLLKILRGHFFPLLWGKRLRLIVKLDYELRDRGSFLYRFFRFFFPYINLEKDYMRLVGDYRELRINTIQLESIKRQVMNDKYTLEDLMQLIELYRYFREISKE